MSDVIKRAVAKQAGLLHYFTGKPCKHGHIERRTVSNGSCYGCDLERWASEKNKAQRKSYRDENKEKISDAGKRRYAENPEPHKERMKKRYEEDPKAILARNKEWQSRNKDALRAYARDYQKRRNREDPVFKMKSILRTILWRSLTSSGKRKSARTEEMLGYSSSDLKDHIGAMLLTGMSWDNYGKWHIDHIRPLASFDLSTPEGIRLANSLHNLQPMWAEKNIKKGKKWSGQLTLV